MHDRAGSTALHFSRFPDLCWWLRHGEGNAIRSFVSPEYGNLRWSVDVLAHSNRARAVTPRMIARTGARLGLLLAAACTASPSFMRPASEPAHRIALLGWWLVGISTVVCIVVFVMLLVPLARRRNDIGGVDIHPRREHRMILVGGVLVPAIILTAVYVFSLTTMSATAAPPARARDTVLVIGHQWWWELKYFPGDSAQRFTTANELHVPIGEAIELQVESSDVIHSFWIPQLQGKIDVVPGQTNIFWLRADEPGTYWGQCAEYCGSQHTHMGLTVVAQSASDFTRWVRAQQQASVKAVSEPELAGAAVFQRSACATCHTIRGTEARGTIGPDLTHIGSRQMLGAGAIPNTRGYLAGWVSNARGVKPGVIMPPVYLDGRSLQALVSYLESLR